MRLWLDDIRSTPEGWVRAYSVNQAKELIRAAGDDFEFASLDHDLGEFEPDGGDGYRLTYWMLEEFHNGVNYFPRLGIRVHSANLTGARRMLADIDDADPYGDAERSIYTFNDYRGRFPEGHWPPALL